MKYNTATADGWSRAHIPPHVVWSSLHYVCRAFSLLTAPGRGFGNVRFFFPCIHIYVQYTCEIDKTESLKTFYGRDDSPTETNIIVNPPKFRKAKTPHTHTHTRALTRSHTLAHKRWRFADPVVYASIIQSSLYNIECIGGRDFGFYFISYNRLMSLVGSRFMHF